MTNDRNLQLAASLSILFLADFTQSMPNVDDGRQAGHLSLNQARLRLWESRFSTYTNSFSFAVFECTHEKIYYIKKETIPHMANTNVCRYSQCIAPKTPTTQTAVKLPMSYAVFFCKQEVATATNSIKALRKTAVASLCEWINRRAKRLNWVRIVCEPVMWTRRLVRIPFASGQALVVWTQTRWEVAPTRTVAKIRYGTRRSVNAPLNTGQVEQLECSAHEWIQESIYLFDFIHLFAITRLERLLRLPSFQSHRPWLLTTWHVWVWAST